MWSCLVEPGMDDALVAGDGLLDVTPGIRPKPVANVHDHICNVHNVYSSVNVIKPLPDMTFHCLSASVPYALRWLDTKIKPCKSQGKY